MSALVGVPAHIAIRDSKMLHGATLSFPACTFAAFVAGLKQRTTEA
ncbi:DUF397 domain-containing protein [Streptomyces griseoincarnatus]|nr:DUF397 domain-containing protein [Streptomyces sp. ZS0098]